MGGREDRVKDYMGVDMNEHKLIRNKDNQTECRHAANGDMQPRPLMEHTAPLYISFTQFTVTKPLSTHTCECSPQCCRDTQTREPATIIR